VCVSVRIFSISVWLSAHLQPKNNTLLSKFLKFLQPSNAAKNWMTKHIIKGNWQEKLNHAVQTDENHISSETKLQIQQQKGLCFAYLNPSKKLWELITHMIFKKKSFLRSWDIHLFHMCSCLHHLSALGIHSLSMSEHFIIPRQRCPLKE